MLQISLLTMNNDLIDPFLKIYQKIQRFPFIQKLYFSIKIQTHSFSYNRCKDKKKVNGSQKYVGEHTFMFEEKNTYNYIYQINIPKTSANMFDESFMNFENPSTNNTETIVDTSQNAQITLNNVCSSMLGELREELGFQSSKSKYKWNKVEQRKYIYFLIKRRDLFDLSNEEKKCVKINVLMGDTVKTRSAAQCHTHHQKMLNKFGSIDLIILRHLELINQKHVPKKYMALKKLLEQYKRLAPSRPKKSQEKSKFQYEMKKEEQCSLEINQFYIDSLNFLSCPSFPIEASSQQYF